MAKELICLAGIGALFYPRQEPGGREEENKKDSSKRHSSKKYGSQDYAGYVGYIRMTVSEPVRGRTGKSRGTTSQRYFPVLFIPSAWERREKNKKEKEKEEKEELEKGELYFNPEQAFAARKDEFAGHSDLRREWKLFSLDSLNVPGREKEKLEVLYLKLGQSLDKIVNSLSPLGGDSASRRTFLACYPSQLREGVNLSQAYGVAANNALRLSLCRQELPSYDGGRVKNKTPLPRKIKEYFGAGKENDRK